MYMHLKICAYIYIYIYIHIHHTSQTLNRNTFSWTLKGRICSTSQTNSAPTFSVQP